MAQDDSATASGGAAADDRYPFVMAQRHGPAWRLDPAGLPTEGDEMLILRYFNRGILWMHAFNHIEAIECLRECSRLAPCAPEPLILISYCHGVDYNSGVCEDEADTFPSNAEAVKFADLALTRVEQGGENGQAFADKTRRLANAVRARCTEHEPDTAGRKILNETFVTHMKALHEDYLEDADIACMYADSIMLLKPWDLYDTNDGTPRDAEGVFPGTQILQDLLWSYARQFPNHIGILHMLIHCLEMSPDMTMARNVAQDLLDLVRGSDLAHLLHMPAHIWIQSGEYDKVVECSKLAAAANRRYTAHRTTANFYAGYRYHDLHMLAYGAFQMGSREDAMNAAMEIKNELMTAAMREHMRKGAANSMETFSNINLHTLIRFGEWNSILEEAFAEDKELFLVYNATLHYARGLAYAALNNVEAADREQALYREALTVIPEERALFNNSANSLLHIGEAMLEGEIEYRKGNYSHAYECLRVAVARCEGLKYDEPWPWMMSPRHALGSLLLEQGHAKEAYEAFQGSLKREPGNIWALSGVALCHEKFPELCPALTPAEKKDLEYRRTLADVPVRAPCLCMLSEVPSQAQNEAQVLQGASPCCGGSTEEK
mmetsp:Transcript_4160/g.9030  ORF Transcript_4160/g.9030 Transcript_4160/m.9030 type:complete len:606 (+) Transcript_4160:197-2014(+)